MIRLFFLQRREECLGLNLGSRGREVSRHWKTFRELERVGIKGPHITLPLSCEERPVTTLDLPDHDRFVNRSSSSDSSQPEVYTFFSLSFWSETWVL